MDGTVFNDCPRHGDGEPKQRDQLKRRRENRCVYCGTPKPHDEEALGLACNKDECQKKRSAELKLTDKQYQVIRGIANGRQNKEIADEMGITIDGVKKHLTAIAHKLGVRCNRALLTRCYIGLQSYLDTPLKRTRRKKTPCKSIPPKRIPPT